MRHTTIPLQCKPSINDILKRVFISLIWWVVNNPELDFGHNLVFELDGNAEAGSAYFAISNDSFHQIMTLVASTVIWSRNASLDTMSELSGKIDASRYFVLLVMPETQEAVSCARQSICGREMCSDTFEHSCHGIGLCLCH